MLSTSRTTTMSLLLALASATSVAAAPHRLPIPARFLGGHALSVPHVASRASTAAHRAPAVPPALELYDDPNAAGGTLGYGINASGYIAGEYIGADNHTHAFLRAPDNSFAEIRVGSNPTSAFWVNDKNEVIGNYLDRHTGIEYAYVHKPRGRTVAIDGAGGGALGTFGNDINNKGTATGDYVDADGLWHGFLREKNGALIQFDEPHAGTAADQGTFAGATNERGDTIGPYVDGDFVLHGFVRHSDGTFDEFDVPGAVDTVPYVINAKGWIVGFFDDANGALHGFVRKPSGRFIVVDAPDAGTGAGQGTTVADINGHAVATGNYVDSNGVSHGFTWANGTIGELADPPGADGGSTPVSINADGTISGFAFDAEGAPHGMVGTP